MTPRDAAAKSSLDAESHPESTAEGPNTHGTLNQHPSPHLDSDPTASGSQGGSGHHAGATGPFRVGVSEIQNKRWRRSMEDSHAFVYNFGGVYGQGFFGVFDGHAGKHAAEWCGQHFHEYLLDTLRNQPHQPVPDLLNLTFHAVDRQLSQKAKEEGTASGCTAVTALLRLEDDEGRPLVAPQTGGIVTAATASAKQPEAAVSGAASTSTAAAAATAVEDGSKNKEAASSGGGSGGGLLSGLAKRIKGNVGGQANGDGDGDGDGNKANGNAQSNGVVDDGLVRVNNTKARRVLYTANVGDARAVLCRGGKAIRLTYDHKGSDVQEAKRITDAGGFVMNGRVNGVLAVTRSLGDSAMKEFVVGSPYTTETCLGDDDLFLIVACDGLWDVTDDQEAVDLILDEPDAEKASKILLDHALNNFSTDNTSVMVIRFASPLASSA
ncbi:mgpp2cl-1, protein phosphatase 2C-like protein 1 [Thecaphora frezii]